MENHTVAPLIHIPRVWNSAVSLACGALASLALTSCFSSDSGFVSREWQSNFSELGIYPKFPAEEDVKVGDVYLIPREDTLVMKGSEGASSIRQLRLGTMLGNVISPKMIAEFHSARYAYEGDKPFPLPSASDAAAHSGTVVPQALRRVAMPEFFRLEMSGADAAGLIPLAGTAVRADLDFSGVRSASVTVDDVASTTLPLGLVISALIDVNGDIAWKKLGFSSADQGKRWLQSVQKGYKDGRTEIFLITKVYYARVFNVDIFGHSSIGGGVATPGTNLSRPKVIRNNSVESSENGSSIALNKENDFRFPDVGYRVEGRYAEQGRVGLRKVYDRYVAIGYRGTRLRLAFDGKSTEIESFSWSGTDVGTALGSPEKLNPVEPE